MHLRMYDWKWSPFCIKVRAILDYKKLSYERIPILGHPTTLVTLRRRGKIGKVPALEIDGRWVSDSTNIAEELERLVPTPSLYPSGPRERALCHVIEDWADEGLYFLGLYYQWVEPEGAALAARTFNATLMGRVAHVLLRRRIAAQVFGQGIGRKPEGHVAADLERELTAVETLVSPGPFLFGETPSLADFALMGQLAYLSRTPKAGPRIEDRAAIAAYLGRMRSLRAAG